MEKQLVKKLAKVMKNVKYIQKTGYNSFNKYKYATEADVNEKVREELAEQNVVMIPSMKSHSIREHTTRSGNTEYIVTAEVEFTFMDGDTGETISLTVFGEGQDAGDKATYKAITGAQKYALMKAFMIPTGDDPEGDEGVDERNNTPQQNKPSTPHYPKQTPQDVGQQRIQQEQQKIAQHQTNRNTPLVSEAQVKYIHKLKADKHITDDDFKRMVAELAEGNVTVKELTKQEASALINTLNNYQPQDFGDGLPF